MKYRLLETLSFATLLAVSFNTNAFNDGDVITFDPGVTECTISGTPGSCERNLQTVTSGSYFAIDIDGDGYYLSNEKVALSPGPDGGIVLGMLQSSPGIDVPWEFFTAPGMHQTTVTPVTQNIDGSLDFIGWEVHWANTIIPIISDNLSATVTCDGALPCTVNDAYQIDYSGKTGGNVFPGFNYHLHLEKTKTIPSVNVSLIVEGGNNQECASTGGHHSEVSAFVTLVNGAELDTIQWMVNGDDAGTSETITPFLLLGDNTVSVTATTINGQLSTAETTVTITDRTRPEMNAAFIDIRTGTEITSIDTKNTSFVGVSITATDICDPSPETGGSGGLDLNDGDRLKIKGNKGKIELDTSAITMSAYAIDASRNSNSRYKTLTITPQAAHRITMPGKPGGKYVE